jgi:hypothetical protein
MPASEACLLSVAASARLSSEGWHSASEMHCHMVVIAHVAPQVLQPRLPGCRLARAPEKLPMNAACCGYALASSPCGLASAATDKLDVAMLTAYLCNYLIFCRAILFQAVKIDLH